MGSLTIHVAYVTIFLLLFQTDACKLNLKKPFLVDEGDQQVSSKEEKIDFSTWFDSYKKRSHQGIFIFILVVSCLLFNVNFYIFYNSFLSYSYYF
jgi:hypothetical protein